MSWGPRERAPYNGVLVTGAFLTVGLIYRVTRHSRGSCNRALRSLVNFFRLSRRHKVYLDLDIEVVKNPTPLFLGKELVFGYQFGEETMEVNSTLVRKHGIGEIPNAFMASVPGHPFWIHLLEDMKRKRHSGIFEGTGPGVLTSALATFQQKSPLTKVAIFPKRFWSPFLWGGRPCQNTKECTAKFPEAFFLNWWTGTWHTCNPGTCSEEDLAKQAEKAKTQKEAREARRKMITALAQEKEAGNHPKMGMQLVNLDAAGQSGSATSGTPSRPRNRRGPYDSPLLSFIESLAECK